MLSFLVVLCVAKRAISGKEMSEGGVAYDADKTYRNELIIP